MSAITQLSRFAKPACRLVGAGVAPIMAPLVSLMARTGMCTSACLRWGCLPMRVHFYSPVPDVDLLRRRRVWARRSDLAGVDLRPAAQLDFLAELGRCFGRECAWPRRAANDPKQYYVENPSFGYASAAPLHAFVRHCRPRRVIEIGSGNSSLVISAALARNQEEGAPAAEYTIVDPYPRPEIVDGLPGLSRLLQMPVENLAVETFDALRANDILFVDSGHTVKTGGDVNFLILDVAPRVAGGVVIHFHDIPLPYEYPEAYFANPGFRVFWTEAYLLQAFLSCNDRFEVLLTMNYLLHEHREAFQAAFPSFDPQHDRTDSGSFWIRRKLEPDDAPAQTEASLWRHRDS